MTSRAVLSLYKQVLRPQGQIALYLCIITVSCKWELICTIRFNRGWLLSVPSILKVGGDVEDLYVHIDVDIDILFLSDPSPIIGNACQWLTHWLTHSLPFSKLDWCDLGLLKTCWGCYCCWYWWWESCWQQFVTDLEAEVWSWSLTSVQTLSALVKILKLKFMRDNEAEDCSVFCGWSLVEVMKLNLGRDSDARLGQDFDVWVKSKCWCFVEVMKLNLGRDSEARFGLKILNFKFSGESDVWLRFLVDA